MNVIEKATIIHYHRHRIGAWGDGTVGALGWREAASQLRRFEVLAGVGDLNDCSVRDVGCGYGDLKGYLERRFEGFRYVGIDEMPEFIAGARLRYGGGSETSFYQADFTTVAFPRVDYVMASGALGYRCGDAGFYPRMIRKMWEAAARGLAFNMLDAKRFPPHPLLIGHNCENVVTFCQGLSSRVEVVRGYLQDDFSVLAYADQSVRESSRSTAGTN